MSRAACSGCEKVYLKSASWGLVMRPLSPTLSATIGKSCVQFAPQDIFSMLWRVILVMSVVAIGLFRSIRVFERVRSTLQDRQRGRAPSTERLRAAIPHVLPCIDKAHNAEAVRTEIVNFAENSRLLWCEFLSGDSRSFPSFTWRSERRDSGSGRTDEYLVKARYELGQLGGAVLRFAWMNKYGNVSPQDEILLQLLADAVEARLSRSVEGHEVDVIDQPGLFN